jgi:hypothetical protein
MQNSSAPAPKPRAKQSSKPKAPKKGSADDDDVVKSIEAAAAAAAVVADTTDTLVKPNTKFDPIQFISAKYEAEGWTVIRSPKGGINDIVVKRDNRYQFVQIVCDDDDPRSTGLSRNNFIQNAFSNGAVPVVAKIDINKKDPLKSKVSYEDVNVGARVIVGGRKKPEIKP